MVKRLGWKFWGAAIGLFLLALFVRSYDASRSIDWEAQQVIITDTDSPYHAHRVFPVVFGERAEIHFADSQMHFPDAYTVHWNTGYDLFLILMGKFFHLFSNSQLTTQIAVFALLPIIGALTAVLLFLIGTNLWGLGAGIALGLLFLLNPYHISASSFGNFDHHVAEYFVVVLLFALIVLRTYRQRIPYIGILSVLGFWGLQGFLVDFGLMSAACFLCLCFWRKNSETKAMLWGLANNFVAAFLLLLITAPFFPFGLSYSFQSLSLLHVLVLFFNSLAYCLLYYLRFSDSDPQRKRVIVAISSTGAVLVSGLVFLPNAFYQELLGGLSFTQGFNLVLSSREFLPLSLRDISPGHLFLSVPLSLLAIAFVFVKRKAVPPELIIYSWIALAYFGMAFGGVKFFRYFSIFSAVFCVWGALALLKVLPQRFKSGFWALLIVLVIIAAPKYARFIATTEAPILNNNYQGTRLVNSVWDGKPQTTVLAPWDIGNFLAYFTKQRNTSSPFLVAEAEENIKDYYRLNLANDFDEIDLLMEKYDSKLLLIDSILPQLYFATEILGLKESDFRTNNSYKRPIYESLNIRLHAYDGSWQEGADPSKQAPAIGRFRLVGESPGRIQIAGVLYPYYKLFEYVPGHVLQLNSKQASEIDSVRLRLKTNTGREFTYITRPQKQKSGDWELRLPYVAPGTNGLIEALSAFELRYRSGKSEQIKVTEAELFSPGANQ